MNQISWDHLSEPVPVVMTCFVKDGFLFLCAAVAGGFGGSFQCVLKESRCE